MIQAPVCQKSSIAVSCVCWSTMYRIVIMSDAVYTLEVWLLSLVTVCSSLTGVAARCYPCNPRPICCLRASVCMQYYCNKWSEAIGRSYNVLYWSTWCVGLWTHEQRTRLDYVCCDVALLSLIAMSASKSRPLQTVDALAKPRVIWFKGLSLTH